jgi:hypothetical protein
MPLLPTLRHYFRRYHRLVAIVAALPVLLMGITGTLVALAMSFQQEGLQELFLSWHTLESVGLEKVYPVLVGLSVIILTITGGIMLPIWPHKKRA